MNLDFKDMNWNSAKAAGKHVASYLAGGISVAVAFHFISPTDATGLNDNLNSIYHGIEEIAKGVAGIIAILTPIYTTWKAANNATPASQAASLTAAVPGTKVITTEAIAKATPDSPNVVSEKEVKVIPK